jgi:hypothetical protein
LKEFQPRSQRQNEAGVEIVQPENNPFKAGVLNDLPGSSIPKNGLSESVGYIPFEDRIEPCGGCSPWSDTPLPPLTGRTGYSFYKTGNLIIKTVGTDFSSGDVGNWIVHDDGTHELIDAYVSTSTVQVTTTTAHEASTAGWVRAQINNEPPEKPQDLNLLHIGTRLFVFDAEVTEYIECYCLSYRGLLNSYSVVDFEGDYAIIFNANGIFRLDIGNGAPYFFWKINSPVPQTLLTGVAKAITKPYGYKHTYSMARIAGDSDTRDRTTNIIEHETGTCLPNPSTYRDYSETWTERPVGDASTEFAVLAGAALGIGIDVSDYWKVIPNGQFGIAINGTTYNFAVDFTGVYTMMDVANRIQAAMRVVKSTILCEFSVDHFIITNPEEGGSLGYTIAGTGGTDIGSAVMSCQSGAGTVSASNYTENISIGTLHCPTDPTETTIFQRHHTHYPVFRNLDIGTKGIDPLTGEGNNEEQFVWVFDVPIAKAFVASRSGPVVTATEGNFQPMDKGSKLRFEDGTEITLDSYIDSTQMTSTDSGSISAQSAAIGGDNSLSSPIRIMTASQTGTAITRTSGTIFSANDVGKPIFWANGQRTHIVAVTDADNAVGAESRSITSTAACLDPKCRNFADTVSDETLRSRILRYSLNHRFWQEFPDCDTGALTSGWVFTGIRDTKICYYNQISQEQEHLLGYYYPGRQYLKYKDPIVGFSAFQDNMAVYCSRTTTVHPTNTFLRHSINGVQEAFLIAGQTVADDERGAWDPASWRRLPDDRDLILTSEPKLRFFDGMSYSVDIADKRYAKTIEKFERAVGIHYDPVNGATIFGKDNS